MSQTLEQRVEDLEKKVAELSAQPALLNRQKNPWRTFGIFKDDPDFEEAVRLGREYREQQTYEKKMLVLERRLQDGGSFALGACSPLTPALSPLVCD